MLFGLLLSPRSRVLPDAKRDAPAVRSMGQPLGYRPGGWPFPDRTYASYQRRQRVRNRTTRSFSAAALLAVGIGIISCGGGGSTSSASPNAAGSPAVAASAATKGSAAVIHLVLTGGPTPGTFDLKSPEKCSFVTQPTMKIWTAKFDDKSVTATIISFTLSVDIFTSPATFTLNVFTPSADGGTFYVASTVTPDFGSGSAEVKDLGATVKMSMNGKTKEGYGATATVQCNQIERI